MPAYYRDLIPFLMTYISGSTAACGTASTEIAIPTGANSAALHMEGAAAYWETNGTAATTSSPGYAAQDQNGFIFSIDNLSSLFVIGAGTAAVVHAEFYQA